MYPTIDPHTSSPHAEYTSFLSKFIFFFPSWHPAVQSLGKEQEVFLHKGEVGKVLSKCLRRRKNKNWEQTNKQKSAPLWQRYSASRLQPKKCEIKKTMQLLSSTHFSPALILSSCNISLFHSHHCDAIYLKYICTKRLIICAARYLPTPSQISVPLPIHPLHSVFTHYMQLYIYLRLLYLTVLYILRYICYPACHIS